MRGALQECEEQVQELEGALGDAQGRAEALQQELEVALAAKEDAHRSAQPQDPHGRRITLPCAAVGPPAGLPFRPGGLALGST